MPSSTPVEERRYTRRGLLKRGTAGGLVVGGAAATYGAARFAAKDGDVVVRYVGAVEEREDGSRHSVDLFYRELDPDGPDEPRIHETLEGRLRGGSDLEDPYRVPRSLHSDLDSGFENLTYHVGHRCPNARCSTPQVSRGLFNDVSLGQSLRLLYLPGSVQAVRVP